MSLADYNEIVQRELQPDLVDTVVYRKLDPFLANFNVQEPKKGDRITSKYRLGHTSNAAFYDKSDVDPAVSTHTLKKPYWTKVFSHGACEVHGIDISNDRPGGSSIDMLADAIRKETESLMDVNVGGIYTQIKKDVDSSSVAYSDASLSRSTYPLLVSHEEATDTAITLALMRAAIKAITLNKGTSISDYLCLMEHAVYYVFKPLAAAIHAWNINDASANSRLPMGYQDVANFEGLDIANPRDFPSMTTGDVLTLRRSDVNVVVHRPLEVVLRESGRDSIKAVLRTGVNVYVDNPYLQSKMTDKD